MPVTSFTSDPVRIKKGESSKLSWTTEGCENCVIMPPATPHPVEPTGSMEVSPEYSTVYLLQCQCGEPPNEWTVLVEVE